MWVLRTVFWLNWLCVCAIAIQSGPNNYDLAHGKEKIKITIRFIGEIDLQTALSARGEIRQAAASVSGKRCVAPRPPIKISVQGQF